MEEQTLEDNAIYPAHAIKFTIPNDPAIKRAYKTYKSSYQTIQLLSEQKRSVYADAFIENPVLGPLTHLCVQILAITLGPDPISIVADDPVLLKVHYDALDVDLPLKKCYHISEERYWQRVVLTKHKDKSLEAKNNLNWKQLGVSLKFVEILEECPVEYWPEDEMKDLALNVKEFIDEIQIKHLQSLRERSFEKYFLSESESANSSEESEAESESSSTLESSTIEEQIPQTGSQFALHEENLKQREQRKKQRLELREAKRKAREIKEARKHSTDENIQKPVKQHRNKHIVNFFDIELSENEDDGEDRIKDKRNKSLYLKHLKKYNYPAKDCHHIDLSLVQYFTNLHTFEFEYGGPLQGRYYHKRHQNFSLNDIKNLARGLAHLKQLHTFRLRNSRLDAEKLLVICQALGTLPNLEFLDLGNDQLQDDCGYAFHELFANTKSLLRLELETNCLSEQVLLHIGKALQSYTYNQLIYLGLARNPLTDQALHNFVSHLLKTKHITELNIRAATFLSEKALSCCVANELLRDHSPLIKLDICAIKISPLAANEIIKALEKNEKLLELYCCACELDEESDIDIRILLQRNKYIADNYFVGDPKVTTEEIENWLNRTKNPIFLKVLAEKDKQNQCLQNRSLECLPFNDLLPLKPIHPESSDLISRMYETPLIESSSSANADSLRSQPFFTFTPNEFDENEFLQHIYQPGPQERYYYFKNFKKIYAIKEHNQNISMI